jgi:hypothetical protein
VFEQSVNQFPARVFLFVFGFGGNFARQKHFRFYLDQSRRHHQKISRQRNVERFHQANVFQIFIRNAAQSECRKCPPVPV